MRKSETARAPGSSIMGGREFYRTRASRWPVFPLAEDTFDGDLQPDQLGVGDLPGRAAPGPARAMAATAIARVACSNRHQITKSSAVSWFALTPNKVIS